VPHHAASDDVDPHLEPLVLEVAEQLDQLPLRLAVVVGHVDVVDRPDHSQPDAEHPLDRRERLAGAQGARLGGGGAGVVGGQRVEGAGGGGGGKGGRQEEGGTEAVEHRFLLRLGQLGGADDWVVWGCGG